jgi:putative oxidoreductase
MKHFLMKQFDTDETWAPVVLRVMMGLVMFPHGAQKLLRWYGGVGFSKTVGMFTGNGMPWIVAVLVILGESIGMLSLIAGFMTRFCAGSLVVIMLGAIGLVHFPHGFFMNWFGNQAGEGYEYHLLVIAICVALTITGGGRASVDGAIAKQCDCKG